MDDLWWMSLVFRETERAVGGRRPKWGCERRKWGFFWLGRPSLRQSYGGLTKSGYYKQNRQRKLRRLKVARRTLQNP